MRREVISVGRERIGVIGGGIVGLAVAREVTRRLPGAEVVVFEKEARLAAHQSGHNSGVVHAGIYYPPGSVKAQLCTRGRGLLEDYLAEHALPYAQCGKLVIALTAAELPRFEELAVAESLAAQVISTGGSIRLGSPVVAIRRVVGGIEVATPHARSRLDRLVLCAGLHADRVARLAGGSPEPRIVPFRGEYLRVHPDKQDLVRSMVYPVPDPRYPFLGVHFTRRVDGSLDVGPNAVLALAREGYGWGAVSLRDLGAYAAFPGFRRMARRHWRTAVGELWGSASRAAYMEKASRYVPAITAADVARGVAGGRAPSPAATSSLAIAEVIVDRVLAER